MYAVGRLLLAANRRPFRCWIAIWRRRSVSGCARRICRARRGRGPASWRLFRACPLARSRRSRGSRFPGRQSHLQISSARGVTERRPSFSTMAGWRPERGRSGPFGHVGGPPHAGHSALPVGRPVSSAGTQAAAHRHGAGRNRASTSRSGARANPRVPPDYGKHFPLVRRQSKAIPAGGGDRAGRPWYAGNTGVLTGADGQRSSSGRFKFHVTRIAGPEGSSGGLPRGALQRWRLQGPSRSIPDGGRDFLSAPSLPRRTVGDRSLPSTAPAQMGGRPTSSPDRFYFDQVPGRTIEAGRRAGRAAFSSSATVHRQPLSRGPDALSGRSSRPEVGKDLGNPEGVERIYPPGRTMRARNDYADFLGAPGRDGDSPTTPFLGGPFFGDHQAVDLDPDFSSPGLRRSDDRAPGSWRSIRAISPPITPIDAVNFTPPVDRVVGRSNNARRGLSAAAHPGGPPAPCRSDDSFAEAEEKKIMAAFATGLGSIQCRRRRRGAAPQTGMLIDAGLIKGL